MGETLTEQRRVKEEVIRYVNFCHRGRTVDVGNDIQVTVLYKKATANYVPAAAVIRRGRALSGFIGRKALVGGPLGRESNPGAQPPPAPDTGGLESCRGRRNSECSGGMRRYSEEHRWRRRPSGHRLTLRSES